MEEIEFIDDSTIVTLENLTSHDVGYNLNNSNVIRVITPNTSIRVTAGEVRELAASFGGKQILQNYIRVCDKTLAHEIGVPEDCIEYWWTLEDIKKLLNNPDNNVLLDALDFAPEGIKEQIKDYAIQYKLPDNNKAKIIGQAFGVDLINIIHLREQYEAAQENTTNQMVAGQVHSSTNRQRRVHQETVTSQRRVQQ